MTETPEEQVEFIETPGPLTDGRIVISGQNAIIGNIKFYIEGEANYELIYPDGTKSKALFATKFLMNQQFCQISPPTP